VRGEFQDHAEPRDACQGLTGHGSMTRSTGAPFIACREQHQLAFDFVSRSAELNRIESYQITRVLLAAASSALTCPVIKQHSTCRTS
jgi:hypothetical protein